MLVEQYHRGIGTLHLTQVKRDFFVFSTETAWKLRISSIFDGGPYWAILLLRLFLRNASISRPLTATKLKPV